ncbi:MAG: T9SS type A sorting domain-containing protein [Muribaculaceae bacterium]|nr:T9SS type A sorting domain-containing protein [Muribaculaceae bacterium]
MRKILTIICAAVIITVSAASVTKNLNSFRDGDILEMDIIGIPKILRNDSGVYDFSGCEMTGRSVRKIKTYNDSFISVYENGSVDILDCRGDSVNVYGYRSPGINIGYILPEAIIRYPFNYGDEISGYFFSEGVEGVSGYLRHCGRYGIRANERGCLITPEGDTIPEVLMTTYTRCGATVADTDFSRSFRRQADSSMVSADSIGYHLLTDSITHRIVRQCWYANGYRYPIIDITYNLIYHYGIQSDSSSVALYYSPVSQQYDLSDDPENERIRQNDYSGRVISSPMIGAVSTKSNAHSNPYQSAGDYQENGGACSVNAGTIPAMLNSCDVCPTNVSNSTIVKVNLCETAQVKAMLYDSSGKTVWERENMYSPGAYSIECDMSSLINGNYIVTVAVGKSEYSYKLVKQ